MTIGTASGPGAERDPQTIKLFKERYARLLVAVEAKNDSELGRALNIKPASVAGVKVKASIPPGWFLEISQKTGFSVDWLLHGTGPMRRDGLESLMMSETPGSGLFGMRGREASGGYGLEYRHIARGVLRADVEGRLVRQGVYEKLKFETGWLASKGSDLLMLRAAGDSMHPLISDGDDVLVDCADCVLVTGNLYVVGLEESVLIRAIEKRRPGKLSLVSFNSEDIDVDIEQIRLYGRVSWWCKP